MSGPSAPGQLPAPSSVLAVCAHPDDESFGLGAVLHHLAARGVSTSVLCFTHGEASTLGASALGGSTEALHQVRAHELVAAADVLGVAQVVLLDLPDGALSTIRLDVLAGAVASAVEAVEAEMLLVFDESGVTGHPDHRRATEAAMTGADRLPVLAWNVPAAVGHALNQEFGTAFDGIDEEQVDLTVGVDRGVQRRAIACHRSQSSENPVLWRRLELLGDVESLRWLRPPGRDAAIPFGLPVAMAAAGTRGQGGPR